MQYTIIGVFDERENAENAIRDLEENDFDPKTISIVMKDQGEAKNMAKETGVSVSSGAATGITTGAVIGGLAGLIGAFVIPGLGAFLIGGPIAATLGLTGATAATVSGAATGAVAGGLIGALTSLGVSREDAEEYQERINTGGILLAIPATDRTVDEVEEILHTYHAANVRSISVPSQREAIDEDALERSYEPDETITQSRYTAFGTKGGKRTRSGRSVKKRS